MAFVAKVKAGDITGPVGSTLYGVCSTAANVAVKEVAVDGLDTLMTGLTIHIKFTNSNTVANPTLRIPSSGVAAKPLRRYGSTSPGTAVSTSWPAGSVLTLTYDGTAWQINDWQADTTYSNATTSAAGLMSAADKTTLNNINTKRTTSMVFTNKTTSTWSSDNTYTNYKFKASISCSGVTANHFAYVCFNPDDALNYVPAAVCQTGANVIYVWTLANPGRSLTIPTILAILPDRT